MKLNPKHVLDVGAGFGKWGLLAREYLDIWKNRYTPSQWKLKLDGVEAWPAYITPLHQYIYSNLIIKPIQEVTPSWYDMIIFGDILEHLEKEAAIDLLHRWEKYCRYMLISTPNGFVAQGSWFGNHLEIHRSGFTLPELKSKFNVVWEKTYRMVFAVLIENAT